MSKVKLVLCALGALVALGALSASVAVAAPTAECKAEGTTKTLTQVCIQAESGLLFVLGLPADEKIELLSAKKAGTASSLVASNGLVIECTGAANTATVDGLSAGSALLEKVVVTFTGCTAPKPEHCAIESAAGAGKIVTNALDGTPLNEDGVIEFTPEAAGGAFATFKAVNSGGTCLVKGEFEVKGMVEGKVLEPEVDQATKVLEFNAAAGLTLTGGVTTTFTLTENAELDRPATGWTGFAEHPPFSLVLTEKIS